MDRCQPAGSWPTMAISTPSFTRRWYTLASTPRISCVSTSTHGDRCRVSGLPGVVIAEPLSQPGLGQEGVSDGHQADGYAAGIAVMHRLGISEVRHQDLGAGHVILGQLEWSLRGIQRGHFRLLRTGPAPRATRATARVRSSAV